MMQLTRRGVFCALTAFTALAGLGLLTPTAQAQPYPTKPLRMIVPWPAGGATDILARALGTELGKQLGQPVVIENRGGAAGKIGTAIAATSPADGYTLYLGTPANFGVAAAYEPSLRYDPIKDFAPVAYIADSPAMLAINSSLPARNMKELRNFAANAGRQLTYASAGEGSSYHLMGELFKQQTKLDLLHVPFQASPQSATAVAGGQVDMIFGAAGLMPYIESGKLRPIAVTGSDKWSIVPDVATFDSQGVSGLIGSWFAIFVPSGTSADHIARLNAGINRSLSSPDFQDVLKLNGFVSVGGTPAALASMVVSDMAIWKEVVQKANLRRGK